MLGLQSLATQIRQLLTRDVRAVVSGYCFARQMGQESAHRAYKCICVCSSSAQPTTGGKQQHISCCSFFTSRMFQNHIPMHDHMRCMKNVACMMWGQHLVNIMPCVCRNVTVASLPNVAAGDRDNWPVLDLQLKRGKIQLCSTCMFTVRDIVLANERQGTGSAYDIFVGQPGQKGSIVVSYNIVR